jgi:hypothetical protein
MILQNLGLMTQALGLCGFPNFARHDYGWFQALGFRMGEMSGSRYVGAPRLLRWLAGLSGQDPVVPYPLGLDHPDFPLHPYCPPYHRSMADAVRAFVETKWGPDGAYRGGAVHGAWKDGAAVASQISAPAPVAIEATIAYCEYVHRRYGRFPAYSPPFRTNIGFQVCRGDAAFYERYYRAGAFTGARLPEE